MKRTVKRIFGIMLCVLLPLSMMPVGILETAPGTLEFYWQLPYLRNTPGGVAFLEDIHKIIY